jgi:hypothetical protein
MAIILVVDDEVGIRELLSEILIDEGYDVRLAENAGAAQPYSVMNCALIWFCSISGCRIWTVYHCSRNGMPRVI